MTSPEPRPPSPQRPPRTPREKARLYSVGIGVAFLIVGVALPFLTSNVATSIPFVVLGLVFIGEAQGWFRSRRKPAAGRGGGD